jgi:hypothetical protein
MEKTYAFVKDNFVVNTAIIDDTNVELIQHLKQELNLDYVVEATEKTQIGATYDGVLFWTHKPYDSWIKGEEEWVAPLPKPDENKVYEWDETTLYWVEVPKPYESWVLNNGKWESPIPKPSQDKIYAWNEQDLVWVEVVLP